MNKLDLKSNGRIFPSAILKNFASYKLPPIFMEPGADPCNVQTKLELRKYQEFIGKYVGSIMDQNCILLYHGLGSGKTATAINLINIMSNLDTGKSFNVIILIKASLKDDPWMKDSGIWLNRDNDETNTETKKLKIFQKIRFVNYDSPFADKDFVNIMKELDLNIPTMFIVDESHNFIRNVYSNMKSESGKRAQVIYDYMVHQKKEFPATKIILISATPVINHPFELALTYNLLRPGCLPSTENEFILTFISGNSYPILNPVKRNMFQRRILGLTSYYIGATPDLYARRNNYFINLPMSSYQNEVYRLFEKYENEANAKSRKFGRTSSLFNTYTRLACNFVFPQTGNIAGTTRPRPRDYNVNDKEAEALAKGTTVEELSKDSTYIGTYYAACRDYITKTDKFFNDLKNNKGRSIEEDLKEWTDGYQTQYGRRFENFASSGTKSELFQELYNCGPKPLAIVFYTYVSSGKTMVYSNYVLMEGLEIIALYFRLIGFKEWTSGSKNALTYCLYHGGVNKLDRTRNKTMFNDENNINGNKCKVILLSPTGTEGIQLYNIRQEHILEPYWNEVRINQVLGRGIRQCSHKQLPMEERLVEVFRYKVYKDKNEIREDENLITTDMYIEQVSQSKEELNQSFLSAVKEAAVDCELFKNHNLLTQSYVCFNFPQSSILSSNPGPAYREDFNQDTKFDSGLGAPKTRVVRIEAIKISAVFSNDLEADAKDYWFNTKDGVVYDYNAHYVVGKILQPDGNFDKKDANTYIIGEYANIPTINIS